MSSSLAWPALPFSEWKDTHATLPLWTQIVGKIRLALCPPINHCWGVALLCDVARADDLPDAVRGWIF